MSGRILMLVPSSPGPRRILRSSLLFGALAMVCLPVSFVVTIFLFPLWSAIEERWGIESVGHSGPATWCFVGVYALLTAGALIITAFADRRGEIADEES
jgi:hypothetical protein